MQGVQEPLQDKSPQSREYPHQARYICNALRERILRDHPKSKTGRGGVTITHLDCNLTHENEIWDPRMGTRMDVRSRGRDASLTICSSQSLRLRSRLYTCPSR